MINGDFDTGDFTGWTFFNTPQGGCSLTQVALFDTAGTGVPSYSAEFEVGETSGTIGGGGLGQGAGIFQNVTLGAGQLTISLDIAATSPANSGDDGTFQLLLDGNVVDSYDMGGSIVGQTLRSTLNYSGVVAAGVHEIAIDARTGYGTEYGNTPYQFFDNITLSGTAVPEPSVFGLLALCGLFFIGRRQFRIRG